LFESITGALARRGQTLDDLLEQRDKLQEAFDASVLAGKDDAATWSKIEAIDVKIRAAWAANDTTAAAAKQAELDDAASQQAARVQAANAAADAYLQSAVEWDPLVEAFVAQYRVIWAKYEAARAAETAAGLKRFVARRHLHPGSILQMRFRIVVRDLSKRFGGDGSRFPSSAAKHGAESLTAFITRERQALLPSISRKGARS